MDEGELKEQELFDRKMERLDRERKERDNDKARIAELTAALEMWKGCTPDVHVAPTFEEVVAITRARDKALATDNSAAADVLKAADDHVEHIIHRHHLDPTEITLINAVARWKGET